MTRLFEAGEVVRSGRVVLSALSVEDVEAMAWLEAALAPEWSLDDFRRGAVDDGGALISDLEGAPIGVGVVIDGRPEAEAATLAFLAIEPARRFRGLGGEAGLALERHVRARCGVRRVYAPVPEWRGLAVYFWLRLGYRPLLAEESPGVVVGLGDGPLAGIWMRRDADQFHWR